MRCKNTCDSPNPPATRVPMSVLMSEDAWVTASNAECVFFLVKNLDKS